MAGTRHTHQAPGPKIVGIELTPLFVPFREGVKQAMGSAAGGLGMAIPAEEAWLGGDFVICRLLAEDGNAGLGEAFVWLPETGTSPRQIIDIVENGLGKYVLGESPFQVERIRSRMDNNVTLNEVAKGMLDMACYDLMGRISGRPAGDFMGGRVVDEIPLAALIPLMAPEDMVRLAQGFYKQGMLTIRVKLGRSIAEDARIIGGMREALGPEVRLRVDYNQAYGPAAAVRAIKAIEPFGIDLAEQPVRAADYLGMAYVQKRVSTPLMCHEGCFSLKDIVSLVELGAVGVIGINSTRPGGVTNALRAITYAELRGLGVVVHDQCLGIASAMQIHLASARFNSLGHAPELFGHVMMEDDLITEELDYSNGTAKHPKGPGFGVELDLAALAKYAAGPAVKLKALRG